MNILNEPSHCDKVKIRPWSWQVICLWDPHRTLWGYMGYFHNQGKLMTSIPDCWKRRDCPTDCKPPAGRVPCPGWFVTMAVMKLQPSGKSSSVSILLDCFFLLHSTQLELGGRGCPHEKSCCSSKGQVSCWRRERGRVACQAGPRRAVVFTVLLSSRRGSQFLLAFQPWGWKVLRWPPPESSRHHEPWWSCPGSSRGSLSLS